MRYVEKKEGKKGTEIGINESVKWGRKTAAMINGKCVHGTSQYRIRFS